VLQALERHTSDGANPVPKTLLIPVSASSPVLHARSESIMFALAKDLEMQTLKEWIKLKDVEIARCMLHLPLIVNSCEMADM